ncbi:hypothetical protein ABZ668_31220, partial [Streptomyces parvus]
MTKPAAVTSPELAPAGAGKPTTWSGRARSRRRAVSDRLRGGDLGLLPVLAGLVVIWVVMQILNPVFLSSANLTNLALESVPVGIIALGVVCVLLVGQIDLSVGSVSGLSAAVLAVLFVDRGLPAWLAVTASVALAALIGWFYAQVHNRIGRSPSGSPSASASRRSTPPSPCRSARPRRWTA